MSIRTKRVPILVIIYEQQCSGAICYERITELLQLWQTVFWETHFRTILS